MGLFIGDSTDTIGESVSPIYSIDYENEDKLLEWEKTAIDAMRDLKSDRNRRSRDNVMRYKGYYSVSEPTVGGAMRLEKERGSKYPRIVVAHSQDLVEQKIATLLKYKPNFEAVPDSGELSDKQSSVEVKKLLDSVNYYTGAPKEYHSIIRGAIITGQGWRHWYWNQDIGPLTKTPLSYSVERPDGSTHTFNTKKRKGDLAYRDIPDWEVFLVPSDNRYDCPGLCWEHQVPVEELQARYPDKAHLIKATEGIYAWSWDSFEDIPRKNHTIVREWFFKSSFIFEEGLYFKTTPDCLLVEPEDLDVPRDSLEGTPLGNIPFSMLTDVDVLGELEGMPSFSFIAPLQNIYDKWFSLCHKNIFLFCHPKWAMQAGSVEEARLSNNSFILPYRSPQPPQLQVYQPLGQEMLKFGEVILQNMEKVFRVYGISRGTPPPGTRAAATLYFYDEQEETANTVFRRKVDDFVTRDESIKLGIISKYYSKDKTRVIQTLGKDSSWTVEAIDTKALSKRYVIRIKSASNLPDSKYARIQALFEMAQTFPGEATQAQVLEMLDFGQQDKFVDYARRSVMSAEGENETMMQGETPIEPAAFENVFNHLKIHYALVQDPQYKKQNLDTQKIIEEHIGAHEVIALEQMNWPTNNLLRQKLSTLDQFPLFAQVPPPPPQPMLPPGASPEGGPQSGPPQQQIPPGLAQMLTSEPSAKQGNQNANG